MTRRLEILGTTVSVPDPAIATALSASFGEMSGSLADVHDTLQTLTRPDAWGEWIGQAADAFGQTIAKLPAELGDIRDAYGAVAAALRGYAAQLEPVVNALTSLASRADEAEGTLTATRNARQHAIAHGHDPHTTGWDARVAEATAVVSSLRAQLARLIGELDALATTCAKRITAAEPRHAKQSLFGALASDFRRDVAYPFSRAVVAVARADGEIAEALLAGSIGVGEALFVHPFTDLWGDAFGSGPFYLKLGNVLGDVAGILGVAALIPGVDVFALPALAVVSAGAAAADWMAVAKHEKGASVGDAVLATVGFGLSGVGFVAGRAVGADSNLFKSAYDDGDWHRAEALENGDDAHASGAALWKAGLPKSFTMADVKAAVSDSIHDAENPLGAAGDPGAGGGLASRVARGISNNVKDQLSLAVRGGDDGFTHSPAAVQIQSIKWAVDSANVPVTRIEDQRKHSYHPTGSQHR